LKILAPCKRGQNCFEDKRKSLLQNAKPEILFAFGLRMKQGSTRSQVASSLTLLAKTLLATFPTYDYRLALLSGINTQFYNNKLQGGIL
jgi:hypothetical protein